MLAARDLIVGFAEIEPVNSDGFHKMMPGLAAVGEVEDPVTVLQCHLNVMASVGEEVESKHCTAGSDGNGAEMSMP